MILNPTSAIDCQKACSEVRDKMKPGIPCRNYRKTLPRPKVGNACMSSYWEGFTDACFATCSGETATSMLQNVCRSAKKEMPKPMVYRSCETGYNSGFAEATAMITEILREEPEKEKAKPEGSSIQKEVESTQEVEEKLEEKIETSSPPAEDKVTEPVQPGPPVEENTAATPEQAKKETGSKLRGEKKKSTENEPEAEPEPESKPADVDSEQHAESNADEEPGETDEIIATMPVTVDDKEITLDLYRGVDPKDSVAAFCAKHMPGVDVCQEQLLPYVQEKLKESGI